MKKTRLGIALVLAAAAACAAIPAQAADARFPAHAIRIVVPQNPGGTTDVLARVIASKMSSELGTSVVVDYKPGAGGNIGMELVAKSAADGYTLLLGYVGTQAVNGAVYAHLPYDPDKDFASIASIATIPFMTVVNNDLPVHSIAGLVKLARTRQLDYATSGNGSLNQLMGEMLNNEAHIKITHIPYKGIAQALTDTIAGRVQVLPIAVPSVLAQVKAGLVRPLAVTSAHRVPALGNVPTMAESGYPQLTFDSWFGLFAPVKTPAAVVQKINAAVNQALHSPDVIQKFEAVGAEPLAQSSSQFAAQVRRDTARWGKVARDAHIHID